ncbi:MAG: response regulator, partial [Leptolyngbya sp. SIO4C1]|nr:response regulator [Leptolyngbya sp. SIO4C1]
MTVTQTATVLIVEDTPSERELISHYLQQEGYRVLHAVSAVEALSKVETHLPDVVVTDVVMPGMSGFELCRSLKNSPTTEKIPIIICSSKNLEIDRLWGMKQGADAY